MRPLHTLRALFVGALLSLASCGAQWRSVNDLDHGVVASEAPAASRDAGKSTPEELHGHRDFPATFERVWDATVQSIHAGGIGVPVSAREVQAAGRIDVDELLVEVEEQAPGRVCVLVRFRGVTSEVGEERAEGLLNEVARRLRMPGR